MDRTFTRILKLLLIAFIFQVGCGAVTEVHARRAQASFFALSGKSQTTAHQFASLNNTELMAALLSNSLPAAMEVTGKNYYWVPFGTGNRGAGSWSELGHWATTSGGSVKHTSLPTAADNVIFDLKSFQFPDQKIILDVEANVKNISWEGIRTAYFDTNGNPLNVYGGFQAHTNLTLLGTNGFTLNFKSTTEDTPINLLNKILPGNATVTFEGTGSWLLQSQFNAGQSGVINLNEGTLKTNNQTVQANVFNSLGDKARALVLGTSTVSNLSSWNVSSSLELNAEQSKITLDAPGTHVFNGGGKSYQLVTLHGPQATINQGNSFKELSLPANYASTAGTILTLESGQIQTIESLFTSGSEPATTIQSSAPGSVAAINFTSYGFCTDNLIISDVTASGPGKYYAGLNSQQIGTTTGWNFISCGSVVYAPASEAYYDTTLTSASIISTGANKWQEITYNGELIGAIKDGGNALGEVTIDFLISADQARALKNTSGAEAYVLPRNWRIKSTNQPDAAQPVSVKLYSLQTEFDNYKATAGNATTLNDLFFTTYSSKDTVTNTENCDYVDNTAQGATTAFLSNRVLTATDNYFTAELTGITNFSEFYLHNGTAAIDFIASIPQPDPEEEPTPEEDPLNCNIIKIKWNARPGSKAISYELEVATDLFKNNFKVVGKFQKKGAGNKTQAFEAKDSNDDQAPVRYYRLKIHDSKGRKYYSRIILVKFNCNVQTVEASPNPFSNQLKFTVNTPQAGDLHIRLLASNLKDSQTERIMVPKGKSEVTVKINSKLKPGMYYLFTELNGRITSQRLLRK